MTLNSIIKENHARFVDLCKQHKVKKIYAFGSSITDCFDPAISDIDVVVELDINDPLEYGEMLISLWDSLEYFFDRKVDLLTDDAIKNPFLKKSIASTKRLIYDGQGEKVFV